MKKQSFILFVIILIISVSDGFAKGTNLQSQKIFKWQDTDWVLWLKNVCMYDENENVIRTEAYENIDDSFVLTKHTDIEYYSNNLMSHYDDYIFNNDDSAWNISVSRDYKYDPDGKILEIIGTILEIHLDYGIILHYYDENGNLTEKIFKSIIEGDSDNVKKYTYEYDQDNMLSVMYEMDWEDYSWELAQKEERIYQECNLIDQSIYLRRNNNWTLYSQSTNSYNEYGQLTEKHTFTYESTTYENIRKYTYINNDTDYEINIEFLVKNEDGWLKSFSNHIYYPDSTRKMTYSYSWENNEWINTYKYVYIYDNQSAVEGDFLSDALSLRCYPNPVKGMCNIQYHINSNSFVEIEILDETGKILKSFVQGNQAPGDYNISVGLEEFSSGAYFYRLMTNGVPVTRQMLLVK